MANRTTSERIDHALMRLANDNDIWIATSSTDGDPHLVPLSLAWIDDRIVVATPTSTLTARNATSNGQARAALDSAEEVVILDCEVTLADFGTADAELIQMYITRVGWDPREIPGEWSFLHLTPQRIQVWNGPSEIEGRTVMRNGAWLTG